MHDYDIHACALGAIIEQARERSGFSQDKLADVLGTTQSFVSRVEQGYSRVSVTTLQSIAQALDTRATALLDATDTLFARARKASEAVKPGSLNSVDRAAVAGLMRFLAAMAS